MPIRTLLLGAALAVFAMPRIASPSEALPLDIWGHICSYSNILAAWRTGKSLPTATCGAVPAGFHTLSSVGGIGDTSIGFDIGYDPDTKRLCFVANGLPEAPVLRVGVGHTLSVRITNTLHDTGKYDVQNCPIDSFGGEGLCFPKPVYPEAPGADGPYYPLEANEAHTADGTSNLHVHGLFVSPQICSDEVLRSAIYPTNWGGPVEAPPTCQPSSDTLTYTYRLPPDHPAGVYWYHTHRHGQAEHQSQMGLVGAIVVEDMGDYFRKAIGVTDEVLLVTDTPVAACTIGVSCDVAHRLRRQENAAAAREKAALAVQAAAPLLPAGAPVLDPRIDQADQAGECAQGASGAAGGTELWTLLLNGAPVPESQTGFPPDSELLQKTMQPGQRQIFRMVNASANSFIAPKLVMVQGGVEKVLPLEVFARDGVGLADAAGNRHFTNFDVASKQLIVPPASRVEFVVHAPPPGAKLYVQSDEVDPGCGGNAYPARRLLLIRSAGTPVDPGAADDSDLLAHEPPLKIYLSTLGNPPTVKRTIVLAEYGRGFTYGVTKWTQTVPTTADYDPSQTDFYITQVASTDGEVNPAQTALVPFTSHTLAPQVTVHLHGQPSVTEDWLIENSTLEIHAFHMHQIHFRDITTPSTDPDQQPILDVINLPAAPLIGDVATGYPGAPGYVRLRMTFTRADIGEFVFHCHILEHEDNGMMAKIRVVAD